MTAVVERSHLCKHSCSCYEKIRPRMWFVRQVQATKPFFLSRFWAEWVQLANADSAWNVSQTVLGALGRFYTSVPQSPGCLIHVQVQTQGSWGSFGDPWIHIPEEVSSWRQISPDTKSDVVPSDFKTLCPLVAGKRFDTFVLVLPNYEVDVVVPFLAAIRSFWLLNHYF